MNEDKPSPRFMRIREVSAKTSLSHSAIWSAVRAGTFPPARKLSPQVTAWLSSDVDNWMTTRPLADPSEGHSPNHRPAAS